ncbi:bifunctional diguanylate cyclase/phosphodiesterase [Curvibacter sp. APW13]|uniref:putative bifunctional diguanylate cyclase/phosphodiesterase n=1 Tax=Curvibacter sp. APW13 TaxID=3077236 RepID=UPI0028DDADA9|nr:bifunctional diguanylate cyclase/phosphodiesterase [Curvibacter sp. APW13]MDT8992372.1 bifunctional diguanylate cyclase/phosphodiesterase [Curvibacter sp. APW13]
MHYPLFINATVSLIMGAALILLWRRDRSQLFTLYLGWANLIQLLIPVAYGVSRASTGALHWAGVCLLPLAAGTYTTLLIGGAAHLAGHSLTRRGLWVIWLVFAGTDALAIAIGGLPLGQTSVASINTFIGLLCAYWLRKAGDGPRSPERLVGPLLVALGLIQFIYVFMGDDGAELLATLGAVLRVTLGLVLLYAALRRTQGTSHAVQDQFWRLTERSLQGIAVVHNRVVRYANPQFLAIYGLKQLDETTGPLVMETIPLAERKRVLQLQKRVIDGTEREVTYEVMRRRMDGTPMWLRVQYFRTDWGGEPALQVLVTDETARHEADLALAAQALRDELTGLPNRAAMLEKLRERCQGTEGELPFVLVLLDLDRFKLFNEAHGHSIADEILISMGVGLRETLPEDYAVMRLGEDEFAILSPLGCAGETAVEIATLVRRMLGKPLRARNGKFFLDASMGIALYPQSARDAESLLRAANAALHVAKRTPGTSHMLAKKEFERGSSNLLDHEQALRKGIDGQEFRLVYQPKVDAHTGALVGFEALARWNRRNVGPVPPTEFIAAAERTGLIGTLGAMLMRSACETVAQWHAHYGDCVPVAINVSPLQMLDPDFAHWVHKLMEETGIQPGWISLEITESSAVQNLEQTVTQVQQLRAMGVEVAMDDFGTGYSSLNMLRNLRLGTVKIDRGLIDPLPEPESVAVVRAICELAEALHMNVVAEGVETDAHARAAANAGCDTLQGYHFAKPLSADEASEWIARATGGERTVLGGLQ